MQAATVVADGDVTMTAGRNLTLESAQNTYSQLSYDASSHSGMIGQWSNPSIGNVKGSQAVSTQGTSQQSSQVASLTGDVTLVAGNAYRQSASSVLEAGQAGPLAGGDVNILARNVTINEAYNTEQSLTLGRHASTVLGGSAHVGAFGASISTNDLRATSSTVDALRTLGQTGGDSRMQALGLINLVMSGRQAYQAVDGLARAAAGETLAGGGSPYSYGVSASLSRNTSQSTSVSTSRTAVGSSVVGANNINMVATGGGQDSNILVSGSTVAAGNTASLAADHAVTLQASADTSASVGNNSSNGASVGVTWGAGAQNGLSIQLGVSQGRGSDNQIDSRYTATQVSGGSAVNISAGGDLTMNGAVVTGNQVTADVGGDLSISTPQDVSVGQSRQSSSGLNLSLCIPPICYGAVVTASASAAGAKGDGMFVSPNTQSGIQAGDGGFNVNVAGDTSLTGAVIESTQAAIDHGRNRFQTGGTLTLADLQNVNESSGSSYSVSANASFGQTSDPSASEADQRRQDQLSQPGIKPGSAGVGIYEGDEQSSTTRSGISGMAGDTTVRTGDTASAGTLVRDWNTQAIVQNTQAQAQITQQFNQHAAREIGTYADNRAATLRTRARDEADPARRDALLQEASNWDEGGGLRAAAHAAAGALSGGIGGALGAGATSALMPRIVEALDQQGLPDDVIQVVATATAAAIGGMAGGSAGASSGYSVDLNNRQLHPTEITWIRGNARAFAVRLSEALERPVNETEAASWLSMAGESRVDAYNQTTNGNSLGSFASEEYTAYMAARVFISENATSTFVDSTGRTQHLFTANASDFNNSLAYTEYTDSSDYRDFYWNVRQINLRPSRPTATEQRVYEERERVVNRQILNELTLLGAGLGGSALTTRYVNGRLANVSTNGGTVELFTDARGPQIPGAVGVGPTDRLAVANDARSMPNIQSNSQSTVIANNPFIPQGTNSMMDFLPEAVRITQPGGTIILNGSNANKYVTSIPTPSQLQELGLSVVYDGSLLPQYNSLQSYRLDGSPVRMNRSVVFIKR